ncbi:CRISPR-associated endonuclease Cas2 [Selenomonas timonae]|uniref:CRISPR-associated endonuclease Cas2 n=1 Tax=Selenomonas timonae TaxID=2754044 RepID=A0A7G7VJ74_9FIRM|nr:CRISPR-associated endonuclease Cas2 [Selenomonas timonae]QNH54167.1 CRISPR-associated endonuclease Cas2 [Selenomonas timonae]
MKYIICYDIKEDRIRTRVVKYLEARALRVQYSVFTCHATAAQMNDMREELT